MTPAGGRPDTPDVPPLPPVPAKPPKPKDATVCATLADGTIACPRTHRDTYTPPVCPNCKTPAHVVTWRLLDPVTDSWEPKAAACINPTCNIDLVPLVAK